MCDQTRRAEIIDFTKHLANHKEALAEYAEALKDGCDWLRQVDQTVGMVSASLGLCGELRDQIADDAPIGAVITISEDQLKTISDPRVAALLELQQHIRVVLELFLPEGIRLIACVFPSLYSGVPLVTPLTQRAMAGILSRKDQDGGYLSLTPPLKIAPASFYAVGFRRKTLEVPDR